MNTEITTTGQDIMNSSIGEGQFLTFELNNEMYGVDILKVQEIRGWTEVTNIPNAPHFIRGVVNLRGAIVPILDMRRRFNMDELVFTHQTVVIVVNVSDRTIGMVVDGVSDVVNIPMEELRPAPDFGTGIDASFLQGLAPIDEENMAIILNIDEMLQACELVQLDKLTDA
ncbi:MAG: chemotaxis protein CheW [Pseudomonadota bacterium]|nr:chemotaxis protein CheW [Pseudomonadota bacterium]